MPAGLAWIASGQQWQLAPHLSLLNKKLLDVSAGRTRRLLVQIAPRHGKSELVSKYFPAWYLGIHPEHRFMLCGYGDEFAATWGRRARDVLAEWGPKLYGVRVSDQSSAADRWDIHKHRGGLIAAGVGGQITGHGAHCFPAGTLVSTNVGPIAIEHLDLLQYQVKVWAYDHTEGRPVLRDIVAFTERPVNDLIEITTTSGRTIRATTDHRFYVSGTGYKEASLLRPGDTLTTASLAKKQELRGMRCPDDSISNLPSVLPEGSKAECNANLCPVPENIRASNLSSRKGSASRLRRLLLLRSMQKRASRSQKREEMQAVWLSDAGATHQKVLLGEVSYGITSTEAAGHLPVVLNGIHSAQHSNTVLLAPMRQQRALRSYGRKWQQSLQRWNELREVVCRDAPTHLGTRRPTVCGVQGTGDRATYRLGGTRGDALQSSYSSHQRRPHRQYTRESNSALPRLPHETPQIGSDTVSVVRRIRSEGVVVYDIQVADCHNFFANEILVHNCLVIDDPHKDRKEADSAHARDAVWEWYTDTVYPRLEPNGKIVLVMQRWHEDDLAGKLLKAAAQGGDQWDVISLPAIAEENDQLGRLPGQALWPERFSVAELERIRANMSPRGWISQYQQRPVADGGTTFKAHWLSRRYHELPGQRRVYKRKVMAIDTAFKTGVANDFSVIQIWGEGDNSYYLIDMWREQVEYPDLKRAIIDQFNLHRPDVILIEDAASGQSIIQDLQRNTTLPIVAVKAKGSKQARADSVTPLWEAGKVLLPEEAPWLHVFLEEHLAFPFGGHDDTVDPGVYALKRLSERGEVGTMPSILDDAPVDERLNVWDALPEAIWDD